MEVHPHLHKYHLNPIEDEETLAAAANILLARMKTEGPEANLVEDSFEEEDELDGILEESEENEDESYEEDPLPPGMFDEEEDEPCCSVILVYYCLQFINACVA
mgnify:CR=1 FL=1